MIPTVVARQTRETILDYLRTTFALSDRHLDEALFAFLDSTTGLFRGPYLDIRLPFRKAEADTDIPLEIAPSFTPYRHQLRAFERLHTRDGHQPQPTLVTTGTGSGKTECFLYPILDHCWRDRGKRGIKAILLYPMNALAADQARRLAHTLWDDPRLKGQVSAGLFVGGDGQHGSASCDHLVDQRSVLRQSPPDILLTNYRMLDFLLLRPEDQGLWQQNGSETLRFLVLDELHTYDGAQGSDVACLIRRLQARLSAEKGRICPIGTSATLGGQNLEASVRALIGFASKVFGVPFGEDSVITEERCSMVEVLGREVDEYRLPAMTLELDPKHAEGMDAWLERQARLWFDVGFDAVRVGERLQRHGFLRQLLRGLGGGLLSLEDLDGWLCAHEEGWAELERPHRGLLLDSYVGLVSAARRGAGLEPFLTVQVQLWLRELRHLVQRVGPAPEFGWESDGPREGRWLPVAYCRSCGSAGWASYQREGDNELQSGLPEIGRAWLQREKTCRFVAPGDGAGDGLFEEWLEPERLTLQAVARGEMRPGWLKVHVGRDCSDQVSQRFLRRCPDCDADLDEGLSLLASRSPSLLSVGISHLFQTGYNLDKKLLAFTDSVQDASHRASFFAARTYRFNLRTAIQAVVEAADADVPLVGLVGRLLEWVGGKMPLPKAIATLMPADLVDLGAYQAYLEGGGAPSEELLEALTGRLSWEVCMEYGYAARVGRTLERSWCSVAGVDRELLAKVAAIVRLELGEGDLLETPVQIEESVVQHFLAGLLQRLRVQGGVDHPLLQAYVQHGGSTFWLSKRKQELLSPFGPQSRLPRFLTDRPPDGKSVFHSVVSGTDKWTWYRDWASRALGIDRKERGIPQLYRRALQRLVEQGVVKQHGMEGGGHAFGIAREAMLVSRHVGVLGCPVCQREEIVPAAVMGEWQGRICTRYRCTGNLRAEPTPEISYYGRRYRSGDVERIFAQEHTGLLERDVRERIEDEFKAPTRPDAPNLFVCTPTLEMGVDIGDLSATVLCSVPPTTANYLQRVGRAGRKTGNALCLTMAEERPHDLYFAAEPLLMMQGQVLPPGCFLDAPEMLKRQLVAFAMDAWARQETVLRQIPPQARHVLGEDGAAKFPGRFLAFYGAHETELIEGFLRVFGAEISAENQARLREFAGARNIEGTVRGAFARIREEREELQAMQRRTRDRLRKVEEDPEAFADPEDEKKLLGESEKLVRRLLAELGAKYPLNVLTDAGVLPNYAFPEPGVTLKATLQGRDKDGDTYEPHEYMRPASTALRELAPWNTFYAEGRKVVIQELDLGNRSQPLHAPWRLCAECHHLELVVAGREVPPACPRCGDARWSDAGQVRELVKFQRVRSLQTRLEAAAGDDGEDRDEAYYQVDHLIDVCSEHYHGAKVIEDLPFGIELLKELPLRELNFGNTADRSFGNAVMQVAGRDIGQDGFTACADCGRVKEPGKEVQHAPWCPGKKGGRHATRQEELVKVFLFREVRSEAIRVLLPVAEIDQERRVLSFQAALELGFRRRFAGDPRHLQIRVQDEPVGGEGRRRFLVVFDTVPGGTGYLSELWHGDHFRDVLAMALRGLEECGCQRRDPPAAGCYQCLYAYQSQRHLEQLSNREARAMLGEILQGWDRLKKVDTLSEVSLASRLESELERFFLQQLQAWAQQTRVTWTEGVRAGRLFWTLALGRRTWEIHAQVDLGHRDGVAIACRPDFVIKPADGNPGVLPVAVFCDGFEYHACPGKLQGRIADDVQKRAAVIASGSYRVWSVTWKDVVDFKDRNDRGSVATLLAGLPARKLGPLWQRLVIPLDKDIAGRPSMALLLEYLARPESDAWKQAAQASALVWLAETQPLAPDQSNELEDRLAREPRRFDPGHVRTVEKGGPLLARWHAGEWFAILGSCAAAAVQAGEFSKARLTLRLFDEAEGRSDKAFEASWRMVLQAWNVLQFTDCSVFTSELVALEEPEAVPRVEREVAPSIAAELNDPVADLRDLMSPDLFALVQRLVSRGAPLPVVGFELEVDGRVAAEAELAWPEKRVAVLLAHQRGGEATFTNAGWKVTEAADEALASVLGLADDRLQESTT